MALRVLIADDHRIVRQGLRALLERDRITVVGEAADGWEAIRLAETLRPDVAVLDFSMCGCNGPAAVQAIRNKSSGTATVILTVHAEEHCVLAAVRAGTRGYVLKTQVADDLIHAVRQVAQGGLYLSPRVAESLVRAVFSGGDAGPGLTARERQMLQLVAEGRTLKESAALLDVSIKTAKSYRAKLMSKLNLHNTARLVRYAIREGVIEACLLLGVLDRVTPSIATAM
jgi:two-component system, NarL family, response regulator NreC